MNKIHNITRQLQIHRITATTEQIVTEVLTDAIIVEKTFVLQINNAIELKILCTPCDIEELVIGLLFSENIINNAQDIVKLDFQEDFIKVCVKQSNHELLARQQLHLKNMSMLDWHKAYSYIKPNKQQLTAIHIEKIINIINELKRKQQIFPKTGAAHAAMLFNQKGEALFFAEDIGRHNAIDKVIGKCLQQCETIPPACGIALSSRVSFELLNKIARAGIELIAAVSAPSSLAIEVADYWQITLCGFVRNGRTNVYTHQKRIIAS